MKPLALGLIFAMAAVAGWTGEAREEGKADGRMSVNGKVVKFSHAYARSEPPTSNAVLLVLTDMPLSDKDLAGFPDSVLDTVNSGKLNALSVMIGVDDKGRPDFGDTEVYDSTFKYGCCWPTMKGKDKIELKTPDENHVAGRGHMEKPFTFGESGDVFDYSVTFTAPIRTWEEMQAARGYQ